ncbi:hypothetical protein ACH5RR_015843 [Cinchona calisaya]|uniref:Uncharacterized protein n=1 Tax=Cinchona calisaya TaxID=153742 RepID=A0ABD2ZV69_9GENT
MDHQEHMFSNLIDRLRDLPTGYNMLLDLRELKANFIALKNHVSTMNELVESLKKDLLVTKKAVASCAKVKGVDVMATMDMSTTHSFVTRREVKRLKLELKKNRYRIKACSLMANPLDDFDLILGKKFMATNKIFPIPHLYGKMITDERCLTFIAVVSMATALSSSGKGTQSSMISAMQLESGLKHRDLTYWAVLVKIKHDVF